MDNFSQDKKNFKQSENKHALSRYAARQKYLSLHPFLYFLGQGNTDLLPISFLDFFFLNLTAFWPWPSHTLHANVETLRKRDGQLTCSLIQFSKSGYRSVVLKYLQFADHCTMSEVPKEPPSYLWVKKKCFAGINHQRGADLMRQLRGISQAKSESVPETMGDDCHFLFILVIS